MSYTAVASSFIGAIPFIGDVSAIKIAHAAIHMVRAFSVGMLPTV